MQKLYNFPQHLTLLIGLLLLSTSPLFAQESIFEDDFETGSLGPAWTARPNLDGGSDGLVEPRFEIQGQTNIGFDGSIYALVMGKTVDGDSTTSALDLALDLSNQTDVELTFWLYNFADDTDPEDGIFFSDDGGVSFTKVLDFEGSNWNSSFYGQLPPLNVDALAADNGLSLTDQFVIRWQQRGDSDFASGFRNDADGFFLDDVVVRSRPVEYATLPFEDDFESGELGSEWRRRYPTNTLGTTRLGGLAEVRDRIQDIDVPADGDFGVVLGRRNDGSLTTNALDLHLDLEGETDVELLYRLYNRADQTQPQDAIWFSDDGGQTFSRVYPLDPGSWASSFYGQLPPLDVDALAAENGLSLTDQFVIRWQQHDDSDFASGFRNDADGFFLEDVLVRRTPTVSVTPPFRDQFDQAPFGDRGLDPAWHVGFAEASTPPGTTLLGGLVEESTFLPRTGAYSARLGRRIDGGETTNALDLNLDLSGQSNVALRFWLADFADETQDRDGLWFSDDGGQSYDQVLDLDPSDLPDAVYSRFVFDVDELASAEGLSLDEDFIIRIQQNDDADFASGFRNDADGFLIDDVLVLSLDAQLDVAAGAGTVDLNTEAGLTVEFTELSDAAELLAAQDPTETVEGVGLPPVPDDTLSNPLVLAQPFIWTTILEPTPVTAAADLCFALSDIPSDATPAEWTVYQFGEDGAWAEADSVALRPNDTEPTQICALGTDGQGDFAVLSSESAIPVELSAFTAAVDGAAAVLTWSTASETNNAGFEIERHTGSGSFERVGFVEGMGTTSEPQNYRFTDRLLPFGTETATYRLRQVDVDGTVELSSAVQVRLGVPDKLVLYGTVPNPVREAATFRYELPTAGPVHIALYNVLGQQVQVLADGEQSAGRTEQVLDMSRLPSGMYFLRLKTPVGFRTQQLMVVR